MRPTARASVRITGNFQLGPLKKYLCHKDPIWKLSFRNRVTETSTKMELKGDRMVVNHFLLYILEKNDRNKTCKSFLKKMFLFVKIFCQP